MMARAGEFHDAGDRAEDCKSAELLCLSGWLTLRAAGEWNQGVGGGRVTDGADGTDEADGTDGTDEADGTDGTDEADGTAGTACLCRNSRDYLQPPLPKLPVVEG